MQSLGKVWRLPLPRLSAGMRLLKRERSLATAPRSSAPSASDSALSPQVTTNSPFPAEVELAILLN
jgi:hypothetical protein